MEVPHIPPDERERLALLQESGLLDTGAEGVFDRLTRMASDLAETPIALVSLVDEDRQWFKSSVGLDASETSRDRSFCGHVAFEREPLLIPDTTADPRFADNPLVTGAPHIRSYFGFPLRVEGDHVMGTLCVIDTRPRTLSARQIDHLAALAMQAAVLIQARIDAQRAAWRTAVVASSSEAILSVDLAGHIVAWNAAATRLFGWTEDEALGLHVSALAPNKAARDEQRQLVAQLAADGRLPVLQTRGRRKDGRIIDVALRGHRVTDAAGRPVGFAVTIRDLTEHLRLERLERDFVSTISHELRTPLTSIRAATGLVLGGVAGRLPADAQEMLRIIESNAERLLRLVNDVLDVQAIATGCVRIEPASLDLRELLRDAVEAVRHLAERERVTLELSTSGPARLSADPLRVRQVVENLLTNALKYSPPQGVVTTTLRHADGPRGGWRVEVADQGPGIPEAFRSRIFQRFAKAEAETHRNVVGTGLGLAICKSLVELHGGRIGYDSEPGAGATFWFELPAGPQAA